MDVLLIYIDSGGPSRYLRYLEVGLCHQVLADGQLNTTSVLLHPDRRPEEVLAIFQQHPARLVGFFFDEFNAPATFAFASQLHTSFPDTPLCAFGIYPALAPDRIALSKDFDYLVIGEGEIALLELANQTIRGGDVKQIKNLWFRQDKAMSRNPLRPLQDNLDLLPYPNRSLFEQEPQRVPGNDRYLYIAASRGCPQDCIFCYSPVLKKAYEGKGNYYRMRSPQNLAGEILGELRRFPYAGVNFVDEMFPTDKTWLKGLVQKLGSGAKVNFQATVAAERIDAEVLDLLKAAGCERLQFGVETGNEAFRKRLATRNLSNDRLRAVFAAARERGIAVVAKNMIGLPLESEPLIQETLTFNQVLNPDEIVCTAYQPIEGSSLYQYSKDKQYVTPVPQAGPDSTLPDFTSLSLKLPDVSPEIIRNYLYRLHFMNVVEKLKQVPKSQGYMDFLAELPRAKFHMRYAAAVDVGRTKRGDTDFAYICIETGSDCRFAVNLRAQSLLRFSLYMPPASFQRVARRQASVVAEVLLVRNGEEVPLYYRAITQNSKAIAEKWQDCMVAIPEDAGEAEILFRASCGDARDIRAVVFWGMPSLSEQQALMANNEAVAHVKADYEAQLATKDQAISSLESQLRESRERELEAIKERDAKAARVGEMHVRILELEKFIADNKPYLDELEKARADKEAGIAGKLKGLFKKTE
ncbi:MAG: radical SAM protein [Candidatus Sumerlaeaceae bacterium]|nr:radical SAM protein [Candidatus Sumerlaeaceae bacterium]